jgi:protein translocase SecG subunit
MKEVILAVQIIISAVLIFLVTIQSKSSGLGGAFGSSGHVSFKRRGLERLIFKATFVFSFLFIILAILQFFVK